MRIRLKPAITISNDEEGKYKLFAPDETKVERIIDTYTKEASGVVQIPATTTETLSLGDVTAVKGLWLSASKDCQVKLNGGAALQLRKATVGGGDDKASLQVEADITSIEITAGTDLVDIVYVVWGDVAP